METDLVITRDMTIAEAMELCSRAPEILQGHGMGCSVCLISSSETIEEGLTAHGLDVDAVLAELNACASDERNDG